jgi:hypothetical protein
VIVFRIFIYLSAIFIKKIALGKCVLDRRWEHFILGDKKVECIKNAAISDHITIANLFDI